LEEKAKGEGSVAFSSNGFWEEGVERGVGNWDSFTVSDLAYCWAAKRTGYSDKCCLFNKVRSKLNQCQW
jgi:hypothetical protein